MSRVIHIFSKIQGISKAITRENLPIVIQNVIDPDFDGPLTQEQLITLQNAEIIVADPGLIQKYNLAQNLPKLKWMQLTWAGVDAFMKSLDSTKPLPKYKLTRFGGYFGEHMAEFVIAHMISYERDFWGMKKEQEKCIWNQKRFQTYRLLQTLQIGILGAGDIGIEVAKACKAFNMTVWGMVSKDVTAENRSPYIDHYRKLDGLSDILSECDWLCCILPSTPQTKHLLSGDVLSACKKKPVLINMGRGDLIDEKSVINAIDKGWISHVILDVFEQEPLPENSALWKHPGVTISPHVSAVSFDWQVAKRTAENFKRYLNGETLTFEVDIEKGY